LKKNKTYTEYQKQHKEHWNNVARTIHRFTGGAYYHHRLQKVFSLIIPKNSSILEIGCGDGSLLAALEPKRGVGIDFSNEMIRVAKSKFPRLDFFECDAHRINIREIFDVIILSDLINDLWDVQTVFNKIKKICSPKTRVIINFYNRFWQIPLQITEKMRLSQPKLEQNWLTPNDVRNLLYLSDFEVIRNWEEILFPINVPLISSLFNKLLVKLWPFNQFALTNFFVARLCPRETFVKKRTSISVIVPARNERGNISKLFHSMPRMGSSTELIFVEGNSVDGTYRAIQSEISKHPEWKCKLFHQKGTGKGDAVRLGISKASGDVICILDADLTVPPEDLPRFVEALVSGKGELINGVRLVYPMEEKAMRLFNLVGNKIFNVVFSWMLNQPIKDTLCGTKVLYRNAYEQIAKNRSYFGEFDPFGDFDLLFGATKLNLKILDMPIRYRDRIYGTTNIQRWKHGIMLVHMVFFAARKIKFI